ncbi:MAG: GNAT family N-acetyltransferase [Faecalibacterium sp.]
MEYLLRRICGSPAEQPVILRRCRPQEAQAVFRLQNEVHAGMPHPEQFVPDTLDNLSRYLRQDLCVGAWQGERLGAYLILRLCGGSPENYAAFLGVPKEEWPQWANADSAVVHPDWRGNGLQRVLLQAALPMLPPGIKALGATISPENRYSLNNALAMGFRVECRREMYGGFDRYLLRKDL